MQPQLPACVEALEAPDQRSALGFFEELTVPAGELLMNDGHEAHGLAWVVQGEVEVHVDRAVVGHARQGEWFGESALFPEATRQATVYAVRDTWLLALPTEGYVAMRRGEHRLVPGLERELLGGQLDRLRRLGERLAAVSEAEPHPPAPGLLGRLAAQLGPGGLLAGSPLNVPELLRQHGIADDEETDKVVASVARHVQPQTVAAGTLLCTEGETGDAMYVLHEGSVDVLKAQGDGWAELATLSPGAAFGLSALHTRRDRMASCVATETTTVLRIDRDGWEALVADASPAGSCFRRAMVRVLASQLSATNALVARLAAEPSLLGQAMARYVGGSV
jgi:CRP-like cAMP-binding protein